jgi:signal peptidase I
VKAEVAERAEEKSKEPRRSDTAEQIKREIISWIWVILAFLIIEGLLVQARVIPSGSMENTVLIGDHLIVSRIGFDAGVPFTGYHVPLWRNPKRQQIIVFKAPLPEQGYPDFIKRCIGVPGDHIKVVMGAVYVNGMKLSEPYALHDPYANDASQENFPPANKDYTLDGRARAEWTLEEPQHIVNGELVVPSGEYFMMGDNRDNSNDSRFWGFVPRENIIGTPVLIYMSIDAPEEVWDPGHIGERFLTYLAVFIHPGEVRWGRLFHIF